MGPWETGRQVSGNGKEQTWNLEDDYRVKGEPILTGKRGNPQRKTKRILRKQARRELGDNAEGTCRWQRKCRSWVAQGFRVLAGVGMNKLCC